MQKEVYAYAFDKASYANAHGVNIANFALGRDESGRAIGVVIVDETAPIPDVVLEELRKVPGIREARIVRV